MFLKDSASLSILTMLLLQSTVAGESAMTRVKTKLIIQGAFSNGEGSSILDLEGGPSAAAPPSRGMEPLPPTPSQTGVPPDAAV